ncbi:hypothetical protein RRG08_051393 [Elysia crispata]|uniref:Uncharacterized protein n=1 Tax=Elysia crispata TaxID=231223 RepID=A0AAE1B3T9_9GAST|nr:hypothetical protein RRG08_051393 [Elysia crispata]
MQILNIYAHSLFFITKNLPYDKFIPPTYQTLSVDPESAITTSKHLSVVVAVKTLPSATTDLDWQRLKVEKRWFGKEATYT